MERKESPSRFPRLPLPEKTGSDRDEPHCLPGFVDRAYLVFLSNYGPQLLAASSDCSKTDPSSSHPLRVVAADSFGVRGGVRAPDDPSPTRASSIQTAAGRLRRPTSADGGADSRSGQLSSLAPFPLEGLTPQPCSPTGLHPRIRRGRFAWLVPIRGTPDRGRLEGTHSTARQSNSGQDLALEQSGGIERASRVSPAGDTVWGRGFAVHAVAGQREGLSVSQLLRGNTARGSGRERQLSSMPRRLRRA